MHTIASLFARRSPTPPAIRGQYALAALIAGLVAAPSLSAEAGPEGRTRTFCGVAGVGHKRACGGHLEPGCTSGSACDAGHRSYSGSPFPIVIDCPWPISDERIRTGCYDERPSCNDCSGIGQVPCPKEAEPFCKSGCDEGLASNPTTTLCESPGTPGSPCGPGYPCPDGLTCDLTKFQCAGRAQARESCANPFVSCAPGLQCTLALECSHEPAREGETCDITAPCGAGLFCQPGIPQRCVRKRRPGEGCSIVNPCIDGASCEPCLVDGCNAPLQCVPNGNEGAITENQCRFLYSSALHRDAMNSGLARTYGVGNEAAAIVGEGQEFGVAYGADGRYGCYTTLCAGINASISIEHFASIGFYETFDDIGGSSFVNVQEAQLPLEALNFSTSQIFSREPGEVIPANPELIGTADAFAIGIGPNILPFSAGSLVCETVLDTVAIGTDERSVLPVPKPVAVEGSGALRFDGEDDRLRVTDATALTALEMTDALTVTAWIRPTTAAQSVSFISKEGEYQLGLQDGVLAHSLANTEPGWRWTRTDFVVPLHRWTHVALVYGRFSEGQEIRVFANGTLVHAISAEGDIDDHHPEFAEFHIGGRERTPTTFAGVIDEVRVWSRALNENEVRGDLHRPADSSAVASWRFEETGGDRLTDASANALNLSRVGAGPDQAPTRTSGARGAEGHALSFDGIDDHVSVRDEAVLEGLQVHDAVTVEAWVYPTGPGGEPNGGVIVSKEGEYLLGRATDGRVYFALANTQPGWTTTHFEATLPENRWHHVALTYEANRELVSLYLDGALVETLVANGDVMDHHPNEAEVRIGGRQLDDERQGNQAFQGVIDEVRLWRVARSAPEIRRDYARVVAPSSAGLMGLLAVQRKRYGRSVRCHKRRSARAGGRLATGAVAASHQRGEDSRLSRLGNVRRRRFRRGRRQ